MHQPRSQPVGLVAGSLDLLIMLMKVHLSTPDVDQFINLLLTTPAKGYENALVYVMPEWTKIQGKYFDSDWEEASNDGSGVPQDILYSSTVPSNVNPSVEHLDAMAKVFDEGDDDGDYDDDLTKVDPVNEVLVFNLSLLMLPHSHALQNLTDVQKSVVRKVISR
ncbi:hypothetical protein BHE74_00009019 [Ensete ventricosum]|nr:hypothetical protein GW17_00030814 [Ensete ventricosum]RWW82517.1 hypothetical protein BHE74_00009019 [Ensete ventricosum]RZR87766.1 hypothetical protein BHM03_00015241 [Ensete ventricosum]